MEDEIEALKEKRKKLEKENRDSFKCNFSL